MARKLKHDNGTHVPRRKHWLIQLVLFSSTAFLLSACQLKLVNPDRLNRNMANSTQTPTLTAFEQEWDLSAPTSSNYELSSSNIQITGNVCHLKPFEHVDNITTDGFSGGSFSGVAWDSADILGASYQAGDEVVRLNTAANTAELDESWTPKWGNIVGYWRLNEAAGTSGNGSVIDLSASENNGTPYGVVFGVDGKMNKAVTFDGTDDYIEVPDASTLDLTSEYTLAAWIYLTQLGERRVISKNSVGSANGYEFDLYANRIRLCAVTTCWFSETDMNTGKWYFTVIAFKNEASGLKFYLNGKLDGQVTPGGDTNVNSLPLSLGRPGSGGTSSNYFSGKMDEVAIWNKALSAEEIAVIYSRQSAKYSGTFTSRVIDGLATSASWTDLSWIPTLPFFKPLPDAACTPVAPATTCTHSNSESSTDYSSLVGSTGALENPSATTDDLMNGIVGLWHLDEAAGTTGSGTVIDHSGNANHGTPTVSPVFGSTGKFVQAAKFNGSNTYITLKSGSLIGTQTEGTISLWVSSEISSLSGEQGIYDESTSGGTTLRIRRVNNAIGFDNITPLNLLSSPSLSWGPGIWHHVVGTWSANTRALYINGILSTSAAATGATTATIANSWLGRFQQPGYYFNGSIDEVAIWNRAIHQSEIHQLYRRGANRIRYQVRLCTTDDCTESGAIDKWKGPDGSKFSYFSELNNTTTYNIVTNSPSGSVKKGLPSMFFSMFNGFSSYTDSAASQRYFQYRVILESDDTGTGCNYGGANTWCSPELKAVRIGPTHYDPFAPTVIGKTGVSFQSLASFAETLGSSCTSGIGYNLGVGSSHSIATWYYWNGSTWTAASGTATQSNTAADISAHAGAFGTQVGTGMVYFKAFLKSDGTSGCELDQVDLGGLR